MSTLTATLILIGCTTAGVFLGAWFAARGFERSLIRMMEEHTDLLDPTPEED